jgi:hypothetical protein
VRGEGCELKLELVEPQQQQLALGAVSVYQQAGSTYICMMGGICMAGWLYLYIYIYRYTMGGCTYMAVPVYQRAGYT